MDVRTSPRRLLAVFLGSIVSATFCAASVAAGTPAGQYVPGQVLVKFKPSLTSQQRAAMVSAMGSAAHINYQNQWVRVTLSPGQSVRQTVSEYQSDPNIEYAQPNYIYHAAAVPPDDTDFSQLWAFENSGQTVNFPPLPDSEGWIDVTDNPGTPGDDIDIVPAWNHITDCSSVIVAVVDTGVNYNQEDLAANMWNGSGVTYNGYALTDHGYNFVGNNIDPMDLNGHGTHVAGIIGAVGDNGTGTTGVCWKADIMAVRVLDASGSGTTSNVVQGIDFAVANGAKVINLSLGDEGPFDQAFSDAITNAENHDVVVVVAAGNNGTDNDAAGNSVYPCDFTQPNLICVAALDQKFALASFSDWGPTSVDVGAPGTNIVSTFAGTNGEVTVPFTSGWTETKTSKNSNGWTAATTGLSGSTPVPMLVDPSGWPTGLYAPNTDDRAYATFNLSGVNAAVVNASLYANVTPDGSISLAYSPAGGDPFAPTSPYYLWGPYYTDVSPTQPSASSLFSISADISACATATCTIGVELSTGTTADYGAALYSFSVNNGLSVINNGLSVNTLTLTTSAYNILNGTSMATPMVTGLAAMLRAYNPQDSYSDVVNAIENGGRPVASLAGMTTSGNAIDVMKSLAYLSPPTGLQATIQ